jgi:hypothetical protein
MKKLLLAAAVAAIVIACAAGAYAWYQSRGSSLFADLGHTAAKTEAAPQAPPPAAAQAPEEPARPVHRYPHLVDNNAPYEDDESIDGSVPLRSFRLKLGDEGEPSTVQAAYRSYLRDYAADEVTVMADQDAAFSEAYSVELPAPRPGVQLRMHVGDFAQDYCGEVEVVYTMKTDAVIALLQGDTEAQTELLADAPCEMERNDDEDFCEKRLQCLHAYLGKKLDGAHFDSPVLQGFAALRMQ